MFINVPNYFLPDDPATFFIDKIFRPDFIAFIRQNNTEFLKGLNALCNTNSNYGFTTTSNYSISRKYTDLENILLANPEFRKQLKEYTSDFFKVFNCEKDSFHDGVLSTSLDDGQYLCIFNRDENAKEFIEKDFYEELKVFALKFSYKPYRLLGEINNKKVFTTFHKNFLSSVDIQRDEIMFLDENYTCLKPRPFYLKNNYSNRLRHLRDYFVHRTQESPFYLCLPPHYYNDNYGSNKCTDIYTSVNFSEDSLIGQQLLPTKNKILHLPSWKNKKTSKLPEWKEVTKSFVCNRKGVFLPVYLNSVILNENNKFEEIYVLCLCHIERQDLNLHQQTSNHSAQSASFLQFMKLYSDHDGLFFKDPEEYNASIRKQAKELNPWLNVGNLNTSAQTVFEAYQGFAKEISSYEIKFPSYVPMHSKSLELFSIKPKPNLAYQKKINKMKVKLYHLSSALELVKRNNLADFNTKLRFRKSALMAKIKENVWDTVVNPTDLGLSTYSKLHFVSNKMLQLKAQNKKFINQAIENKDYIKDSFIDNLSTQNISILAIKLNNGETLTSHEVSNLEDIQLDIINKKLKILEVVFSIDKPVKIYVDSKLNPKAVVLGGPYVIKVNKNSLKIKLKDKTSLFGTVSETRVKPHPHSGEVSASYLTEYANACLGEATSLIYGAFEKENNLKNIIISSMLWVTSANSTDAWGRSYVKFLPASLLAEQEIDSQESIQPKEVDEFLSSVNEAAEENALDSSAVEEIANQQQPQPTAFESPILGYNRFIVPPPN